MEKKTYTATRELLTNTPLPTQTRTYKPVSHEQLIDLTLESIHNSGFELDKELYTASCDGQIANGRFTISNVNDRDMQLQIGWQNSYNKMITLKFAIGVSIFICQNGCVSGDYGAFKKKHVGEVQTFTPNAITEYIKQAGDSFKKMQTQRDAMKQIQLTERRQAEIVGRLLIEEKLINTNQATTIAKELMNPTHDYGANSSLWEMYQYTTYAMKEVNPRYWMDDHIGAHDFFINEAGILIDKDANSVINNFSTRRQLELFETI